MRLFLTLACLLITHTMMAQQAAIISRGHFTAEEKSKHFVFLDARMDTAALSYVATFKIARPARKAAVSDLFLGIKSQAQSLGANSFRLKAYTTDSGTITLILDTYFADDSLLAANEAYRETNRVYIFCGDQPGDETYSLKINDRKVEFTSGTYLKLKLRAGEKLKLNKGGFTGATDWLSYEDNKQPVFLSVTGFGLGESLPVASSGIAFTTGRLNPVNPALGLLLVQVLKPVEIE